METTVHISWKGTANPDRAKIRQLLRESLVAMEMLPCWKESAAKPAFFSVTQPKGKAVISINGHVAYTFREGNSILQANALMARLEHLARRKRNRFSNKAIKEGMTAIVIAFFPKCPVCWATYMSALGFAGMSKFPYLPWLVYVFMLLAGVNVYLAYQRDKGAGNRKALALQLLLYALIFINWKLIGSTALAFACILCLVMVTFRRNLKMARLRLLDF